VNVVRESGHVHICPVICIVRPLHNLYRWTAKRVRLQVQWLLTWRVSVCRHYNSYLFNNL